MNARIFRLLIAFCVTFTALMGAASVLHASGSYVPPPAFANKVNALVAAAVGQGKALLVTRKAFSSKDQACMTCHDKGAPQEFSRSRLKNARAKWNEQINKCITDKERLEGEALKDSDKRLEAIKAYLMITYRVP